MNQTKQILKNYLIRMAFVFSMLGFCLWNKNAYVLAAEITADEAKAVEVSCVDFEQGIVQIKANHNTKVFYSDSAQKTWNVLEGKADGSGILTMDISWISAAKDYELNLKGSDDETVVSVDLPKYNSKLKVKFDKVDGTLEFTNEEGAKEFEWRKAAAIDNWAKAKTDFSDTNDTGIQEFLKTIEAMRVRGGKIQVRIPGNAGPSDISRPSKIVTVSITKRGNAPSVKVTSNTMQVNTTDKMEYKLISVGGTSQDGSWCDCDKKMYLSDMTPQVFPAGDTAGQDVVVAVRKKETEKAPYSKSYYLAVPAQPAAPVPDSVCNIMKTTSQFGLTINNASKETPYQYAVVPQGSVGSIKSERDLKWKTVSNTKEIKFSNKKYPEGSVIYLRTQGVNLSKKADLKLPSVYTTIEISYAVSTPEPSPAA